MDKVHFKECAPEVTVQKLKKTLEDLEIETQEVTSQKSSIGTYTLRVEFKGTNFGSNGKGVSKKYCEASAYAELFERFQNDMMPFTCGMASGQEYPFQKAFDERYMTTAEIISDNNSFTQFYFKKRGKENASFAEKVDLFNTVQRTDFWMFGNEGTYLTLPFYGFKRKRVEYLPMATYGLYYGSNGMCAGNTPQEALVQGLSEIMERVAQKRVMIEQPALPDIPQSYIDKYPLISSLFGKLKSEDKEHEYFLKDCSFGGKYPVAALICVEKNTGRFGVKLGCHPNYGIAMERCFTEATQGRDVSEYAKISYVDFHNTNVDSDMNICNTYKTGQGQFPYQIFGQEPTYPFFAFEDVSNSSNEEILRKWIDEIMDEGYDILVRDVSYSGFPSYHIIIPGLSELQDADDKMFRATHTKLFVQDVFSRGPDVPANTIPYILATLQYYDAKIFESGAKQLFADQNFNYPGEEAGVDSHYLQAMCYAYIDDYENAEKRMQAVLQSYRSYKPDKDLRFYACVTYLFSAMSKVKDMKEAMAYIRILFDQETCEKVSRIFKEKKNIFAEQYPCGTVSNPENERISEIRGKLFGMQILSGIAQENVAQVA